MVALKPHQAKRRLWLLIRKQERRGGIETGAGAAGGDVGSPGSRNAVVALKLRGRSKSVPPP